MQAEGTFEVKSWDEQPYDEIGGGLKLTRARVTQTHHGAIEGEGTVEYLMAYREGGTASFVGLERVVGTIGGRSGSVVLQHSGTFEGGAAKSAWAVVPGSGTERLKTLRGKGSYVAEHGGANSISFEFDFE